MGYRSKSAPDARSDLWFPVLSDLYVPKILLARIVSCHETVQFWTNLESLVVCHPSFRHIFAVLCDVAVRDPRILWTTIAPSNNTCCGYVVYSTGQCVIISNETAALAFVNGQPWIPAWPEAWEIISRICKGMRSANRISWGWLLCHTANSIKFIGIFQQQCLVQNCDGWLCKSTKLQCHRTMCWTQMMRKSPCYFIIIRKLTLFFALCAHNIRDWNQVYSCAKTAAPRKCCYHRNMAVISIPEPQQFFLAISLAATTHPVISMSVSNVTNY